MKESLDLFPAGGIHRRVSARSPQLTGQPRLGGSPIAQDGGLGYAEQLGALRHVEAAEEPALDHQCLTRLEAGERLEGGLETEQLIRGAGRLRDGVVEGGDGQSAATFLRLPSRSEESRVGTVGRD